MFAISPRSPRRTPPRRRSPASTPCSKIVVPAVVDAGGHVNKFLGDGALAVFGAPNDLGDHAEPAVNAAVMIQALVAKRFQGELRIGIGINTGVVIAGTIGGAGKRQVTLVCGNV